MNPIRRILRSMRHQGTGSSLFESYYAALVRQQPDGGPTAAEARRDFRAVREPLDRIGLM